MDKIYTYTSVKTIMYYEYKIKQFLLSGINNLMLKLISKSISDNKNYSKNIIYFRKY